MSKRNKIRNDNREILCCIFQQELLGGLNKYKDYALNINIT